LNIASTRCHCFRWNSDAAWLWQQRSHDVLSSLQHDFEAITRGNKGRLKAAGQHGLPEFLKRLVYLPDAAREGLINCLASDAKSGDKGLSFVEVMTRIAQSPDVLAQLRAVSNESLKSTRYPSVCVFCKVRLDWHSQFVRAEDLKDSAERYQQLAKLSADFVRIAALYGRFPACGHVV
jgi:hypothetical protein